MKRMFFFFVLLLCCTTVFGQVNKLALREGGEAVTPDSLQTPPITDYKIISLKGDTTYVDTTLTIQRAYAFNYLRKDNFEALPFSNVGRPYAPLGYTFGSVSTLPQFGARARHANYMEVEDIFYYHVPTAITEFMFKTTFEQGQILDVFFTMNTTPGLNFSVAYKGVRSLGKYQHVLNSSGNLRIALSYDAPNKKYHLRTHFTSQDLMNQENGGLTPKAVQQFLNEVPEFNDRSLLEVKFDDAENKLLGKRFYLNHSYTLSKVSDTLPHNRVEVGHIFNFTDKEYTYDQKSASPWLGLTYENINLHDELEFQNSSNQLYLAYANRTLGTLKFKAAHNHYNYGYRRVLILDQMYIPNRISGDIISIGASYTKNFGGFAFNADAMLNVSGDYTGNYLKANLRYEITEESRLMATGYINSKAPNYNFQLYQSDYKNYNWRHHFENVETQGLSFQLQSDKWASLEVNYTQKTNYAYFKLMDNPAPTKYADSLVKPFQYSGTLKYLKVKGSKTFNFGWLGFANTIMYQEVLDGEQVFHVPSFVTRNSLYYQDYWFEKAMYLQTGFTLNYFSGYKMNGYDPVLAEFYVQNKQEIENDPTLDFFFNAKVSQARLYFTLQNVGALFTGNTNLVAPGYAYRDFSIRFGIVWDVFM